MMNPDGIGPLLRHLREQSGRTRKQLAEAVEAAKGAACDEDNIKRWETGKRIPTPYWREAIATVYGIPVKEINKAVEASKRERRLAGISTLMNDSTTMEYDVDRRAFLSAAALAAGAATEPWGRLAAALGGSTLDQDTVQGLQVTTDGMFESEEHVPARLMFARLTSHLDTLTALLPTAGRYRNALTIAAGETAALAGWMSWDMGDHTKARSYYGVALDAAKASGHGAVGALALGYASYGVEPQQAREMLTAAQLQVRGPGFATARAWLSAREAEEAAKAGDREAAVRALERARTAFDYACPGDEQAWVAFLRPARLESMAVSTYSRLRHPELTAAADGALAALGDEDAKIRCSVLGDVAAGYLVAGDVEQAVEVGGRALDATIQDDTTMGRIRLEELAEQLPDGAAALELRERIRAVV